MQTKRIEYIDAMRGFAMFLVVYSHIWTFGYHADAVASFDNILSRFFLSLFFFVSGFVAYKEPSAWSGEYVKNLLRRRAIQLLVPATVFTVLLYHVVYHNLAGVQHITLAEYWFTINLFVFYLFYTAIMLMSKRLNGGGRTIFLIIVTLGIYGLSFSHNLIERTDTGTFLFHYLGMKYWRYFAFFVMGVLIREHLQAFLRLLDNSRVMSVFVLAFFAMIFYEDNIQIEAWKPIGMLVDGFVSIVIVYALFRKYQHHFSGNNRFGTFAQLVGRRTLDIYMIHYFLLPRQLNALGTYFTSTVNPTIEFAITTAIALLVITLSIFIGNIIRLSPALSHYLLGTK